MRVPQVPAWLLVVLQFLLAAVLALTTRLAPARYPYLCVAVVGAGLMVWAWLVMGLRRLHIMPHVRDDTELVTTGPYRLLRHPMYTGLLIFCLGLLASDYQYWKMAVWLVLLIDLDLKARLEERHLLQNFPDYQQYSQHTWRLLPWVY